MEVKFVHDNQGQAILAMPTGLLSDSELLDRISRAYEIVYNSMAELRPDETIVQDIERRLADLRGMGLGNGLKIRANEKLYGSSAIAYGVTLLKDRLVIESKHMVDDAFYFNWVHFFPSEDRPRCRPHGSPRFIVLGSMLASAD